MQSANRQTTVGRLKCLDTLRGIAALGIVFWHFQHFGGDPSKYPYRETWGASWMYARGTVLVDFFFLISGIVFTFKYLAPIVAKKISAYDFFVLRFSRIYPLHAMTLVAVAGIQWWRMAHHEPTLIYQNNDAYHFVLNLLFLQAGWFEDGYSYNNPSWSIASEALVYFLFFLAATRYSRRYIVAAVILALFGMTAHKLNWSYPLANVLASRAIMGFFIGSLLYLLLSRVIDAGHGVLTGLIAAAALAFIGVMTQIVGYDAFIGGSGLLIVPSHVLVIFPLILTVALSLPWVSKALSLRPLTYLGDISFTIYLVHVPIQMGMLAAMQAMKMAVPTSEPTFFWTFLAILFVVAATIHRIFEVPAQTWLRRRLLSPSIKTATAPRAEPPSTAEDPFVPTYPPVPL